MCLQNKYEKRMQKNIYIYLAYGLEKIVETIQ